MATLLSSPLLLVDGYNIIGAWPSLTKVRDSDGFELARRELIEILLNYTAHKGYSTRIVFDAHFQKQPASCEQHTPYLAVHYTDWMQDADTYIEKFCATWSRQIAPTCQRVMVATSDYAQRLTVQGYGAEWISAQQLATEVQLSYQTLRRKQPASPKGRRQLLFNRLNPRTQQQLTQFQKKFFQK